MEHVCKIEVVDIHTEEAEATLEGEGVFSFGPAITNIIKLDGIGWVAHCGEYASAINFCPFCGEKLK